MNCYQDLWRQLTPLYDETEAKALVRIVLEICYGMSLTDILCGKVNELSAEDCTALQKIMNRLATAEPIQYVLGETQFAGRTFKVGPGVLIPRPETEELCQWIVEEASFKQVVAPKLLDIGTGSGCIAITLASDIPDSEVTALDISPDALQIAETNATALNAQISFECRDVLNISYDSMKWDIIVSNPPYILPSEAKQMERNVLEFEPDLALFTPEDKPLLFYESIAKYAQQTLVPNGNLYFEINLLYANQLEELLKTYGFIDITLRKDMFGKQRMMKATKPLDTSKTT